MNKPFFAYRSFWKEFDAMKRFASIGVNEFALMVGNTTNSLGEPYCQYPPVWKWYDAYDFAPLDQQFDDLIKLCPEAKIICLIDLNSPLWLARQLAVDSYPAVTLAETNSKWKSAVEAYLKAFLAHTEKHYGDRIFAYVLMCGTTDEWMDFSNGMGSLAKLQKYKEWCALHKLPEPEDIPGAAALEHTAHELHEFALRDPQADQKALQYWKFHSEMNAGNILHFASVFRSAVSRPCELGVFYGYLLEVGERAVCYAHLAYETVESSPLIDFVISPGDYYDREMGGGSGFMTPNGTVKLHQKGCLYEIDHRTHSANMKLTEYAVLKWMKQWNDLKEDCAGLRREFCRTLFHGSHLWWFDMWGGFFDDPENMEVIRKCREIWEKYADRTFQPEAEIALIVDPESAVYAGPYQKHLLWISAIKAMNRLGTPYEIYSVNDIPRIPARIRFAVMTGVFQIDSGKKRLIDLLTERCTLFWNGPAGVTDGKKWEQQELPGIKFPGFSKISASILREEASKAGVHFFTDQYCPVWYGRSLLSVHSAEGGKVHISLKEPVRQVEELFSGKIISVNGKEFVCDFEKPETMLFRLCEI